ncbi:hypothetical protein [Leeuwenhoekiella nanhaiensis]|uniref:Acetolactate synthase small subunit C-terminal domain-containing protein n=1 Tax=Leeuwenhoekiella nanhaiensis TaxID=1655491 RepID=A0A2G1VR00_9FLAO|nr:hypothetical protein [Leeuwenhoekiella nanhaiensis]PHQ29185.1 hypothetical protein CJ305_11300 [Leeuwenhoekiella nanhaiensis]
MRAQLQLTEAKNSFQQEALVRCLNRIMEVRILDCNLKKRILFVEFTGPKVFQKIQKEIERLGLAIGEKKILPDPFALTTSSADSLKTSQA